MAKHNELGEWGEEQAVEYFITKGFTIVAQDETQGKKEVDIIALKGDHIHFVEVKTRSDEYVDPLEAVTPAKRRRICRFADSYLRAYNIPHTPQFDVVGIIGSPEEGVRKFEYIPDAFLPGLGR